MMCAGTSPPPAAGAATARHSMQPNAATRSQRSSSHQPCSQAQAAQRRAARRSTHAHTPLRGCHSSTTPLKGVLPQIGEPVYLQRETERGYCGVLSANGLLCWVPRWTLQPISPPPRPTPQHRRQRRRMRHLRRRPAQSRCGQGRGRGSCCLRVQQAVMMISHIRSMQRRTPAFTTSAQPMRGTKVLAARTPSRRSQMVAASSLSPHSRMAARR